MSDLPEHVRKNRAKWDDLAKEYAAAGERGWVRDTPVWGIWHVPEAELHMLPDDLNGKDAIELGCGQADHATYITHGEPLACSDLSKRARLSGADLIEPAMASALPISSRLSRTGNRASAISVHHRERSESQSARARAAVLGRRCFF
jgi:hypothetical protein